MYVQDFSFRKYDSGFATKNGSGWPLQEKKSGSAKMFATGGPRCPVKLLKMFLSHRPEEIKSSAPFYLMMIECQKH